MPEKTKHNAPAAALPPPTSSNSPSENTGAFRFSSIEFFFWFAIAFGGYVVVYLQSIGYNATKVGIVNALTSAVGIFATPFWGMISDKTRSTRRVLLVLLTTSIVLFTLIPASTSHSVFGISLVFLAVPIACFFRNPSISLLENWVVHNSAKRRLNYGAIRGFGSIGYAIVAISISFILPKIGVASTFYLTPIFTIPVIVLIFSVKEEHLDAGENGAEKKTLSLREMNLPSLFRNFHYVTFLIFAFGLSITMFTSFSFLPYLLSSVGVNSAMVGILTGYRAIIEVPMLLLLKPLRRKFPLYYLLLCAGVIFAIESLLYGYVATSFLQIILIITLGGIANGLQLGSASNFIYAMAPDHLKATAQTVYAAVNSVSGIIGSLLGGVLVDHIGTKGFYSILGVLAFSVSVFYAATFLFGEKVLHIKRPRASS